MRIWMVVKWQWDKATIIKPRKSTPEISVRLIGGKEKWKIWVLSFLRKTEGSERESTGELRLGWEEV